MPRTCKRLSIVGVTAALCLSIPPVYALAKDSDNAPAKAKADINVTSYNMMSSNHDDEFPDNTWADRQGAVADIIKQDNNNPDVLGIQEGQAKGGEQIADLANGLGNNWEYTSSSDRDYSASAIFWRDAAFDMVDAGDMRVVDADVDGFKANKFGRWALLKHVDTGESLLVFNVHLPNGSDEQVHKIRYDSCRKLAKTVKKASADNGDIPAIVTGDLNSHRDTVIGGYESSTKILADAGLPETYDSVDADARDNPDYASHFDITQATADEGADGSERVDYIHSYTDQVETLDWRMIINFDGDSKADLKTPVPSDHHPVASKMRLTWN